MPEKRRMIIVLPTKECDGCGKCVEACRNALNGKGETGGEAAGIKIIASESVNIPVVCRNCQDAPCVTSCMTGCISKTEDGLVVTDTSRCVGCWICVMNCPFGAIERAEDKHITVKCNGCLEHETAPCVAACELGVLTHMEIRSFTAGIRKQAASRFIQGPVNIVKA